MQALRIIRDEHRSLAAVLDGMLHLVHDIRDRDARPEFGVLGAMLYYIDAFPERFHHPKEDRYLFEFLRVRCSESHALLDRLEWEHGAGAVKVQLLAQTLARYQQGGKPEFGAFAAAVESFANLVWDHMRCEEQEILPLAEKHLLPEDWEAIDAAFAGHTDPLFGLEADHTHQQLFQRVVNLAPPSISLGLIRDAPAAHG